VFRPKDYHEGTATDTLKKLVFQQVYKFFGRLQCKNRGPCKTSFSYRHFEQLPNTSAKQGYRGLAGKEKNSSFQKQEQELNI
jgi:hypothetical protein